MVQLNEKFNVSPSNVHLDVGGQKPNQIVKDDFEFYLAPSGQHNEKSGELDLMFL